MSTMTARTSGPTVNLTGPGKTNPIPKYHQSFQDALPSKERVAEVRERLEKAGVKYVISCWIDLFGIPKTKPVPMTDFDELCAGKGPQFAVHSISFVPELSSADSDQVMVPDLDAVYICPWDRTTAFIFADLFGKISRTMSAHAKR